MQVNYEILFWTYVAINLISAVVAQIFRKKQTVLNDQIDGLHKRTINLLSDSIKKRKKSIKAQEELSEKYELSLQRENYLLKTMNDAMKVTEPKGFMLQRMKNAPKEFEPKTQEEVKPDQVD